MKNSAFLILIVATLTLAGCSNQQSSTSSGGSKTSGSGTSTSVGPHAETRGERMQSAFLNLPIVYLRTANTYIEHDTTSYITFNDFSFTYENYSFSDIEGESKVALSKQEDDKELEFGSDVTIDNAIISASFEDGGKSITVSQRLQDFAYSTYIDNGAGYFDLSNQNLVSGIVEIIKTVQQVDESTARSELDSIIGANHKVKLPGISIGKLDPTEIQEKADRYDAELRKLDFSLLDNEEFDFLDYAVRYTRLSDGHLEYTFSLNKLDLYALTLLFSETEEDIKAAKKTFDEYKKMDIDLSCSTDEFKILDSAALSIDIEKYDGISFEGDFSFELVKDLFDVEMPESYSDYKEISIQNSLI